MPSVAKEIEGLTGRLRVGKAKLAAARLMEKERVAALDKSAKRRHKAAEAKAATPAAEPTLLPHRTIPPREG